MVKNLHSHNPPPHMPSHGTDGHAFKKGQEMWPVNHRGTIYKQPEQDNLNHISHYDGPAQAHENYKKSTGNYRKQNKHVVDSQTTGF